jgi:hypothetical protein
MLTLALLASACGDGECNLPGNATVYQLNVNFEIGTPRETIDEVIECIEARVVEESPPSLVTVEISGRERVCDALDTLEDEDSVNNVVFRE